MRRYLVVYRTPNPRTGTTMNNRRVISADSVDRALEDFVKMGYSEDSVVTVWQEALSRRSVVNYDKLKEPD